MRDKFDFGESIIFSNDEYVVINKPPFISTLQDRNEEINILQAARAVEPNAQVCHRLDKETSGVLAIARTPAAYRHMSMLLEKREVIKVYHAVSDGVHRFDNELVDVPIRKKDDGTVRVSRDGKESQTTFTTISTYKSHTLIECIPRTGRMHQIRVHLAHLNAPISGDSTYGGKPVLLSALKRNYHPGPMGEEPLTRRMALHAVRLEFMGGHGERIKVEAPYPKDFRALLKQLAQNTP